MTSVDVVFDNWEIFYDQLKKTDMKPYQHLDRTADIFAWADGASTTALLRLVK
jgi:hypothetical protein